MRYRGRREEGEEWVVKERVDDDDKDGLVSC